MLFNKLEYPHICLAICVLFLVTGCVSENAEELFSTNDAEATVIYDNSLKSILENKCINCHNYHLEGTNRYDNFEKTKSSIGQMLERINATSNISMPPDGSPQLTEEEKLVFQEFFDILNSDDEPEEEVIALTFTAYKYLLFEERDGVTGTFNTIQYDLNEDYTKPIDMLSDAQVTIETSSVDIDGVDGLRTMNVGTNFFAFFSPTIVGQVINYNETEATITFTMNNTSQDVNFDVSIEENVLVLRGTIIDMNLFNWMDAYAQLETVCGDFHENKVWPDVDLEARFPIN